MYLLMKQIMESEKNKMEGGNLVLSIGYWLNAGRSECKLSVDYKS